MPKDRNLLFVIADGEHVRFVRPAADNALHSENLLDSPAAHQRSSDLGSDRPGASYHTGSSAHHGVEPRHDMHILEKEKFARCVARWLDAAATSDAFDELVLVAPPDTLTAIRTSLNSIADGRIVGTLPKDLVKVPDHELWPHLRSWIRPTHRLAS